MLAFTLLIRGAPPPVGTRDPPPPEGSARPCVCWRQAHVDVFAGDARAPRRVNYCGRQRAECLFLCVVASRSSVPGNKSGQ